MITQRSPLNYGLKGLGALNCPGDPGCPGNTVVPQVSPVPDAAFLDAVGGWIGDTTAQQLAANPPALYPTGFSAWLAQNQSAVLWGLGALVLLSFASEGRR